MTPTSPETRRRHTRRWTLPLVLLAAVTLAPAALRAQDANTFTLSLLGGLGGSVDEEDSTGLDNPSFEVGFTVESKGDLLVGGRAGTLDFQSNVVVGGSSDVTLDYAHIGGEYRFTETLYESGIYFGLGYYELSGRGFNPGSAEQAPFFFDTSDTSIGLVIGVTGEFKWTDRVGLLLQATGHVTDLSAASIFATAHAGLAFHF